MYHAEFRIINFGLLMYYLCEFKLGRSSSVVAICCGKIGEFWCADCFLPPALYEVKLQAWQVISKAWPDLASLASSALSG